MSCCGQLHVTHEYDFVVDSKQLVWTESQLSEKMTIKEKTFLGLNDYENINEDGKIVVIWIHRDRDLLLRMLRMFHPITRGLRSRSKQVRDIE